VETVLFPLLGSLAMPSDRADVQYRPLVHSEPLGQRVYRILEERILDGRLRPGERLVETELARQLGVSRGPIREALHLLAREGWLEVLPRQGTYVRQYREDELEDFFHVRSLLEVQGARLAARTVACQPDSEVAAQVAELEHTLERALAWSAQLDAGKDDTIVDARQFHREASRHFHRTVAGLARSSALAELSEHLAKRTRWYFSPRVLDRRAEAWREHADLTRAIAKGDEEGAVQVMRRHMERTRESYLRAFRSR
jgi:DNA-binding GntR family transcriptional regulator